SASTTITANKSITGEFGLPLKGMLTQAKKFVEDTDEFLIFKFDKSTNYEVIAEYCVTLLGKSIYTPIGIEFSKLTLADLKGKVVCVFNEKGRQEIQKYGEADGILGFRSLRGKDGMGTYKADYAGLQYYGKGGTNPFKVYQTNKAKREDNEGIQKKILLAMARQEDDWAANVLGMMYWTSTGSTSSIRERNEITMWSDTGVTRMNELWRQGLKTSIETQLQRDQIRAMEYGGQRRMKA